MGRGAASAQEQELPSSPVPASSQLAAVVAGQGHGDNAGSWGDTEHEAAAKRIFVNWMASDFF